MEGGGGEFFYINPHATSLHIRTYVGARTLRTGCHLFVELSSDYNGNRL